MTRLNYVSALVYHFCFVAPFKWLLIEAILTVKFFRKEHTPSYAGACGPTTAMNQVKNRHWRQALNPLLTELGATY